MFQRKYLDQLIWPIDFKVFLLLVAVVVVVDVDCNSSSGISYRSALPFLLVHANISLAKKKVHYFDNGLIVFKYSRRKEKDVE